MNEQVFAARATTRDRLSGVKYVASRIALPLISLIGVGVNVRCAPPVAGATSPGTRPVEPQTPKTTPTVGNITRPTIAPQSVENNGNGYNDYVPFVPLGDIEIATGQQIIEQAGLLKPNEHITKALAIPDKNGGNPLYFLYRVDTTTGGGPNMAARRFIIDMPSGSGVKSDRVLSEGKTEVNGKKFIFNSGSAPIFEVDFDQDLDQNNLAKSIASANPVKLRILSFRLQQPIEIDLSQTAPLTPVPDGKAPATATPQPKMGEELKQFLVWLGVIPSAAEASGPQEINTPVATAAPTEVPTIAPSPTVDKPKWSQLFDLTQRGALSIDNTNNATGWNNKKVAMIKMQSDELNMQIGIGDTDYGGGIYFINSGGKAGIFLGVEKQGSKTGFFVELKDNQGKQVSVSHLSLPPGREFRLQIKNHGKIIAVYPIDGNKPIFERDIAAISPDFKDGLFPDNTLDGRLSVAPKSYTAINKLLVLDTPGQKSPELLSIFPPLPNGMNADYYNSAYLNLNSAVQPILNQEGSPMGYSILGKVTNISLDDAQNIQITLTTNTWTGETHAFTMVNNHNIQFATNNITRLDFKNGKPAGGSSQFHVGYEDILYQTDNSTEAYSALQSFIKFIQDHGVKDFVVELQSSNASLTPDANGIRRIVLHYPAFTQ